MSISREQFPKMEGYEFNKAVQDVMNVLAKKEKAEVSCSFDSHKWTINVTSSNLLVSTSRANAYFHNFRMKHDMSYRAKVYTQVQGEAENLVNQAIRDGTNVYESLKKAQVAQQSEAAEAAEILKSAKAAELVTITDLISQVGTDLSVFDEELTALHTAKNHTLDQISQNDQELVGIDTALKETSAASKTNQKTLEELKALEKKLAATPEKPRLMSPKQDKEALRDIGKNLGLSLGNVEKYEDSRKQALIIVKHLMNQASQSIEQSAKKAESLEQEKQEKIEKKGLLEASLVNHSQRTGQLKEKWKSFHNSPEAREFRTLTQAQNILSNAMKGVREVYATQMQELHSRLADQSSIDEDAALLPAQAELEGTSEVASEFVIEQEAVKVEDTSASAPQAPVQQAAAASIKPQKELSKSEQAVVDFIEGVEEMKLDITLNTAVLSLVNVLKKSGVEIDFAKGKKGELELHLAKKVSCSLPKLDEDGAPIKDTILAIAEIGPTLSLIRNPDGSLGVKGLAGKKGIATINVKKLSIGNRPGKMEVTTGIAKLKVYLGEFLKLINSSTPLPL